MTSFDVRIFHNGQAEPKHLVKLFQTKTTANVLSKAKSAIASAFRVSSPAYALA
jgi:hypothetical protein